MSKSKSYRHWCGGLTLIELVIALAVAGILLAAGYGIFVAQQKTYAVQDRVVEIQQHARTAMNLLARDLRMAGHGVPTDWPVNIGGNTYSDAVTALSSTLTVMGCFGSPGGYLATSAKKGDKQIVLVDARRFDTGDRSYVFIGEYDKAMIDEIHGNMLTLRQSLSKRYPTTTLTRDTTGGTMEIHVGDATDILEGDILRLGDERLYVTETTPTTIEFDTDPTTPTRDPIQYEYPAGTRVNPIPVYFVQVLRYTVSDDGRITREDLSGGGRQTLAEDIDAMTIGQTDSGAYRITLAAKADVPDEAGKRRGRGYDFTVTVRNQD